MSYSEREEYFMRLLPHMDEWLDEIAVLKDERWVDEAYEGQVLPEGVEWAEWRRSVQEEVGRKCKFGGWEGEGEGKREERRKSVRDV